jgi:hypothetical protein
MVLVTPQPAVLPGSPPRTFPVASPGTAFANSAGVARDEVLALLRDGSEHRPHFHPGLGGGLRAWLEDGASELVAARGEDAPPLFLGPRLLWDGTPSLSVPATAAPGGWAAGVKANDATSVIEADPYPMHVVQSCLVRALFRQIVTTGQTPTDPMVDALDALRVDPSCLGIVRHVDALDQERRAALATSLSAHVAHLLNLTPRFAPGWLPRTDDRVAIPLAGGRVVLCGVFDLLVGAPVPGTATLCAVGLTTGGRWAQARMSLHYLALLETLRSGSPPFRVALLHSAVGRYGVEDVLEEHLRSVVSHVVARLSSLGRTGPAASVGTVGTGGINR